MRAAPWLAALLLFAEGTGALAQLNPSAHPETLTEELADGLVIKALLDRERASKHVAPDFAQAAYSFAEQAITRSTRGASSISQSRAIAREAQRRARMVLQTPKPGDSLGQYPDPQRVVADMHAASRDASEYEIAGRLVGRFEMLAGVIAREGGGPNAYYNQTDAYIERLRLLYRLYSLGTQEQVAAAIAKSRQDCGWLSQAMGTCPHMEFEAAAWEYGEDPEKAREVANLYFSEFQGEIFRDRSRINELGDLKEEVPRPWWHPVIALGPWVLGGIAALILLIFILRAMRSKPQPEAPSTTFGSAAFHAGEPITDPFAPLKGVLLGKQTGNVPSPTGSAWPLFSTTETHTLIVAPTRTGKGTRIIIPTLLRYFGSMVVIDPKGENAAVTGLARTSFSRSIVLNPWGLLREELASSRVEQLRFNPLDVIKKDDSNAVSVAQSLAETVCKRSNDANNSYWEGNAAAILTSVMLYLADSLGEALTLARVREIITLPRTTLERDYFTKMAASSAYGGAVKESIGPFIGMGDRELAAILTTLNEATRFMSDPQLKAATAQSDFDINLLATEPITLFLVIPPAQMTTHATWLRLVLTAVTNAFRYQPKRKTRCMMLVDEMPALGKMPDLAKDLATMSGFGLDYTLIVQDLGQLREHYGEASKTILANCGWKWFCNIRDYDTAKYLSDALGDRTIATRTTGTSTNPEGHQSSTSSQGEAARKLRTPDEIMKEGREAAIVFGPTGRPWFVRPVDYWNLKSQFAPLGPSMAEYFHFPLVWGPNPYVPGGQQKPPDADEMARFDEWPK